MATDLDKLPEEARLASQDLMPNANNKFCDDTKKLGSDIFSCSVTSEL